MYRQCNELYLRSLTLQKTLVTTVHNLYWCIYTKKLEDVQKLAARINYNWEVGP